MTLTPERAAELGRLSAAARRERPVRFPPLNTPADARACLEYVSRAAMAGRVSASLAGAQERVIKTWLLAYTVELDMKRMKELERRCRQLEDELAQMRRGLTPRRVAS